MRKFVLTIGLVATFVVYTLVLRHQHSAPVVAPASLSQANTAPSTGGNSSNTTSKAATTSGYRDGTYTGNVENAYYGDVQVAVTIQNGRITGVNFLQYPNDNPNSQYVNSQAMPYLKQEAVKAQSAHVDVVSGATFTSQAFTQSLSSALSQATQNS